MIDRVRQFCLNPKTGLPPAYTAVSWSRSGPDTQITPGLGSASPPSGQWLSSASVESEFSPGCCTDRNSVRPSGLNVGPVSSGPRRGRSHLHGHACMHAGHGDMEQAVVPEGIVRRLIYLVGCDIRTHPQVPARVEDQVVRAGKSGFRAAGQERACCELLCGRVAVFFPPA